MSLLAVLLIVRLIDGAGAVVETRTLYDPTLTVERCEEAAQRAYDGEARDRLRVLAVCQEWEPIGSSREVET